MAYLKSASRRGTIDLDNATPKPRLFTTPVAPADLEEPLDESAIELHPYAAWSLCAEKLEIRNNDSVKAWADQADGLVTFAALFSAVVTSFIIDSYTALQPDSRMITVHLLRQILAQLDAGTAAPDAAASAVMPFEPSTADVVKNALLIASLICTLIAGGVGIFYKQWLREFARGGVPSDPRERASVRQLRYLGLHEWRMQTIISGVSAFLQLGVAFFILALVLFAASLHSVVSLVLNVFVVIWVAFWLGTAVCPLVSIGCPFRSSLSRLIFSAVSCSRRVLSQTIRLMRGPSSTSGEPGDTPRTMELQEVDEAQKCRAELETRALQYLFARYWGDAWLADLEPCIAELPRAVALNFILDLVEARCGPACAAVEVCEGRVRVKDPGVMRLARLWRRICASPGLGQVYLDAQVGSPVKRAGQGGSSSITPSRYPTPMEAEGEEEEEAPEKCEEEEGSAAWIRRHTP